MKNLGILILAVGVAISAAYGARLSPSMREQMVARGRAQLLSGTESAAHDAYCASFTDTGLPPIARLDGCAQPAAGAEAGGEAGSGVDVEAACAGRNAPEQTREEIVASGRTSQETHYMRDASRLSAEQQRLRTAWLAAADAAIEPAADAALLRPVPPSTRLAEWFADGGVMFLLGLALVILGAVIGRIAVKREAASQDEPEEGEEGAARDLGHMLDEVREEIAALSERASGNDSPEDSDFRALKDAVHDVQMEKFEPLVAAAPKVQAKYGMSAFAQIFGPLSASERHVNRAWSALVDRHWPEATDSLARAAADIDEAHGALDAAMKEQSE